MRTMTMQQRYEEASAAVGAAKAMVRYVRDGIPATLTCRLPEVERKALYEKQQSYRQTSLPELDEKDLAGLSPEEREVRQKNWRQLLAELPVIGAQKDYDAAVRLASEIEQRWVAVCRGELPLTDADCNEYGNPPPRVECAEDVINLYPGVTPLTQKYLTKVRAPLRHDARVMYARWAVSAWVARVTQADTVLWKAAVYDAERAGPAPLCGYRHTTARHPAFAACGKGRKMATDGEAWTAAIRAAESADATKAEEAERLADYAPDENTGALLFGGKEVPEGIIPLPWQLGVVMERLRLRYWSDGGDEACAAAKEQAETNRLRWVLTLNTLLERWVAADGYSLQWL